MVIAPWIFKSLTKTGRSSGVYATIMFPIRCFKSSRLVAKQRIAMISEATVILNPSLRSIPLTCEPCPIVMSRKVRSFKSKQRLKTIFVGSTLHSFPW